MSFIYDGIWYTILSSRKRTVGTGNYTNKEPNAVNSDFGDKLIIPEEVVTPNGVYFRVTEIGPSSFYGCSPVIQVVHTFASCP